MTDNAQWKFLSPDASLSGEWEMVVTAVKNIREKDEVRKVNSAKMLLNAYWIDWKGHCHPF